MNPLGLAEQFELAVETPGRVALPLEVRTELGLKPGDLFLDREEPRLSPARVWIDRLAAAKDRLGESVHPEDLLGWVYARLNDSRFLRRFSEQMRSDFPRVPLPEDRQQFQRLAGLGRELVSAHLLEHPRPALAPGCALSGDAGSALSIHRKVLGSYDEAGGRIRLNENGLAFEGIEPEVWRYQVGSYRVLETWLRARAGRVLSLPEARDFRRIATALRVSLVVQIQIENA